MNFCFQMEIITTAAMIATMEPLVTINSMYEQRDYIEVNMNFHIFRCFQHCAVITNGSMYE